MVVTSWTDARTPWPRCQKRGQRGGSGLLVEDELARAVRCESAAAVAHWWGVGKQVVSRWRGALGVPRYNEGSARLQRRNGARGADATRGLTLPPAAVKRRHARARELGLERAWTPGEVALLGTMKDGELAERVGCSRATVARERVRHNIPAFRRAAKRGRRAGPRRGRRA